MENQNPTEVFDFTILQEEALTEDLFDDQTHERVSQNLASIITSSETGFTIGLEGSWGSGKSTVINLLREKLFNDSNLQKPLFFLFDAWAHEGDPLRRIFLESIIRELDPEENIDALTDLKRKINGRNRSVDVSTKKSTSMLGKILSVAALLIAPGATFLGRVDYNLLSFPWQTESSNPYYLFIIGIILSFAPILALIFWAIFGQTNKVTKRRSWDFFTTESVENYTQDITEDNERSSIEFEDYFKIILEIAKKECKINKFIFVIDNLDRVDSTHALNIWSTLQTFFQKRSSGNSTKNNLPEDLWFLIPYDREGFISIWPEETGSSFLRKCFQLIVEVPDPVMSGWASYAELTIKKALGTWPKVKLEQAIFFYIQNISRLDKSPTPRDIKSYSNQIGMLGKTWGEEFSIESMSLYVLLREDHSVEKIRKDLVAGQIFTYTSLEEGNSELLAELSGLIFGVVKGKGLQLLLGPELRSAFQQGNGKQLSNLKSAHGTAFWIAYESSKSNWMPTSSHTMEYRTQLTKAFYLGLMDEINRIEKDINKIAENWMESIPNWEISSFDYSKPMRNLFELYSNTPVLLEKIRDHTTLQIEAIVKTIDSKTFTSSALSNIYEMEQLLEEYKLPLNRFR